MSLPRYRITRSEEANQDLADTFDYIASKAGPSVAQRFVERLMKACRSLDLGPHRGAKREELGKGIRAFGVERKATIVFSIDDEERDVKIIAVLYGGRDIAKAIKDRKYPSPRTARGR